MQCLLLYSPLLLSVQLFYELRLLNGAYNLSKWVP